MVSTGPYPRLLQPPAESFFLLGLRGSGKSTWARQHFPDATRFDLLDESLYQAFLRDPALFGAELRRQRQGAWVVVDEVQRLPSLLNEVHRAIEDLGLRFVLLGSSARKLKAAGTNLLAGRAVVRSLHPFVPAELGDAFDLNEVLRYGSLPIVWQAPSKRDRLEAYTQLYLREEIQAEALVRNLSGFARFLPIAALFHGQVINVAGLARDAGVARTTVSGYLEILADTHLVSMLPAYEARLRVKERKHPKLFWTDPGIVRAMKRSFHAPVAEERGALLEGWVAELLRAHNAYAGLYDGLFYWAPAHGSIEVDFLIQRGRELIAVEVKAATRPHQPDFAGLSAIAELATVRRRILVHTGPRAFNTADGIEALPAEGFAELVASGRL
ncbi:MAG: ATP-binding protein [Acidobacteria bacterium]|nr:ATP-binding protein [Acidobacteriota bacterium]